jgi:hypothetical protein
MKITLFITYMDKIHTVCNSQAYDVKLVITGFFSSHSSVTKQDHDVISPINTHTAFPLLQQQEQH